MHKKNLLMLILGFLCCVISLVHASDDTASAAPETQKTCDAESEEACATEKDEEELDRGFDPCLINASLPACKSDKEGGDSGAAEKAPSDAEDPDGSG